MTTDEKSTAILRRIVDICNDPALGEVTLTPDWGGNALTVAIGENHTHVGDNNGSFENLVDRRKGVVVGEGGDARGGLRMKVDATLMRHHVVPPLRSLARQRCVRSNCGTVCLCDPCHARKALETLDPTWRPR